MLTWRTFVWVFTLLFILCLCFFFWSRPSPTVSPSSGSPVRSKPCNYVSPKDIQIKCYWVKLPEDEWQTHLSVAAFKRQEPTRLPPLLYLAGGPGESGNTQASGLDVWSQWYQRSGLLQDFLVLDLRGLAPSTPNWECNHYLDSARKLMSQNFSFVEEMSALEPIINQCFSEYADAVRNARQPPLSVLNSRQYALDLQTVMLALGYQQWDLLGVSYGTRLALIAAMEQSQVRRIILDSPYSLEQGLLSDTANLWADAFQRFFNACDQGLWGCPKDVKSADLFWRVYDQLSEHPLKVGVEDWSTGQSVDWVLNGDRFAALIYSAFYSSELYFMLFPALTSLQEGNVGKAQFLLTQFYNQTFDESFNNWLFWATECNDNGQQTEQEYTQKIAGTGRWQAFFNQDWQWDICDRKEYLNDQKPIMKTLKNPVLVTIGEWDPVTPLSKAKALMQWLPRGLFLPLTDTSHAEFFKSTCAEQLIPWFLSAQSEQLARQWSEKRQECEWR